MLRMLVLCPRGRQRALGLQSSLQQLSADMFAQEQRELQQKYTGERLVGT